MKQIIEAIDIKDHPDFIHPSKRSKIETGKLGYEPLMPRADTTHTIASDAYDRAIKKLRNYIPEDEIPASQHEAGQLIMGMMQTLPLIKSIENEHVEYLEMLAIDTVLSLPEFESAKKAYDSGNIKIEATLIPALMTVNTNELEKDIEELTQSTEFDNFEEEMKFMLADVDQEKFKRRFQNIMTQGAAGNYMYLFEYVRDTLEEMDPELPKMYGFMQATGDISLWLMPEMNLQGQMVAGEEEIDQDEDGAGVIKAKGIIFPLLMHEIVKGLVEYINTHSLPESPEIAQHVLSAVDKNENEIYDLMLGPIFWKKLSNAVGTNNSNLLFHVWGKIIQMPAVDSEVKGSFAGFIKELLSDPDSAKRIIQTLVLEIEQSIQQYEQQSETEPGISFESYVRVIEERVTNMMKSIMQKYSALFPQDPIEAEKEMEQWAAVDPTGEKGFNIINFLKLKEANKIKSPSDISKIVKAIPEPRSSLPTVLKWFINGTSVYPEDLQSIANALKLFFKYRNKGYWYKPNTKEPADRNLQSYKTSGDLFEVAAQTGRIEKEKELEGEVEIAEGDIKIYDDCKRVVLDKLYEVVRILPTVAGCNAVDAYNWYQLREGLWSDKNATKSSMYQTAHWCVGSWSQFIRYLKLENLPDASQHVNKKINPPQHIIDDPLYSFYMIAKDGLPYRLCDFQSNTFNDAMDRPARDKPDYEFIKELLSRANPAAMDKLYPDNKNKPSVVTAKYIRTHPEEVAKYIISKIKTVQEAKKLSSFLFDRIVTTEQLNSFYDAVVKGIDEKLNTHINALDSEWGRDKSSWANTGIYSGSIQTTKKITIDTPAIKKHILHYVKNYKDLPTISDGESVEKAIYNHAKAPNITNESFGSVIRSGAAAAALALSSPAAATIDQPTNTPSEVQQQIDPESHNIITRTLWAEGHSDKEDGMRAIASVIHNRGNGEVEAMIDAIKAYKQFSCWNSMTSSDWENFVIKNRSGAEWETAKQIATELIDGTFTPVTTADHYFNPNKAKPSWGYINGKLKPHEKHGSHVFMKLGSFRTR